MTTKHQPDRMVGGRTNGERAEWARIGLDAFGRQVYGRRNDEDLLTAAGDFLCDLLHLAAAHGYNPHEFLATVTYRAETNYDAETVDEPHEGEEEPPFLEKPYVDWQQEEWWIHEDMPQG